MPGGELPRMASGPVARRDLGVTGSRANAGRLVPLDPDCAVCRRILAYRRSHPWLKIEAREMVLLEPSARSRHPHAVSADRGMVTSAKRVLAEAAEER